jgi:glycine dehydrogenase subunit 2
MVAFDGSAYRLDHDRPDSVGRVKDFAGNVMVVLRAYAWIMNLGAEGLREVADTTVLNNNYLAELLLRIPGFEYSYGTDDRRRLDQIRFTLQKITEETGITAEDFLERITDFGLQKFWLSHHPITVPEPMTPEPTETNSVQELEEWAAAWRQMVREAHETPEVIRTAPHNGVTTKLDRSYLQQEQLTYLTWRQWRRAAGES